jgi:hypothetical protein
LSAGALAGACPRTSIRDGNTHTSNEHMKRGFTGVITLVSMEVPARYPAFGSANQYLQHRSLSSCISPAPLLRTLRRIVVLAAKLIVLHLLLATLLDALLPRVERSLALRFLGHIFACFGIGLLLGLEGHFFFVHFAFFCFLWRLEGLSLAACVVVWC